MKRWLGQSLQRKLSVFMLLSTILPLLALGLFSYLTSSRITEQNTRLTGTESLEQMTTNVGFMIQDVEHLSVFLISQRNVQQFLALERDQLALRSNVDELLTNLLFGKDYIFNITLYPKNDVPSLSTMTIYESEFDRLIRVRDVKEKTWTPLYELRNFSGTHQVVTFVRPVRRLTGNVETIGWLSITLSEAALSRNWSDPQLGDAEIALVNEDGMILSSTDKSALRESFASLVPGAPPIPASNGSFLFGEGADKLTVLHHRVPSTAWTLIGTIPYAQYSHQNRYILQLTAVVVALAVLINVGLTLFLVRRVTNPLRVLTRLLAKVDPNKPMHAYPIDSSDEIGRLAHSYNTLGKHIERLKEQLIQNESRKKEADLRALQAQINPHFLYNTLSSIQWIALMNEENRIAEMVGALGDFLRFSLNNGKDFCTVGQEIAHIRNYAAVQAIRYPDKFTIDYSVDPTLEETYMLKLLLQPIVENALVHGIQKKPGQGTIAIHVERIGRRMCFQVLDSGKGMTEEQLARLRGKLEAPDIEETSPPGSGYGLRNVNERLQLHYGAESRLKIDSRPEAGTRVSFSIPIMEEQP
ncbi:sensor histidine kinase [Paenibacillus sp.]|uniref:cache domain-containing sensor histidine kinase n=1 Tax=Paenibacillus sp. TaxID=58172 RepID=UPI002D416847|nr:sensor histidine kinase [Paenibacillus sp.]HZG83707.1 sensor histidine kinase [Paenibacillus sp.]